MVTLAEIEAQAMVLTEGERAELAERLLESLAGEDTIDPHELAEVLRRRTEMERDPSTIISMEQLLKAVAR